MELKNPPDAAAEPKLPREYGNIGDMLMSTLYDSQQYARFVLMRFLRMVLSYAMCGAGVGAFAWGAFIGVWAGVPTVLWLLANVGRLMGGRGEPPLDFTRYGWNPTLAAHPFLISGALIAAAVLLFGLYYGIQVPYRLETSMPGIWTYPCWRCGIGVRDEALCTNCGALRPGHLVTWALWGVSAAITGLYLLLDLVFAATMLAKARGK